MENMANDGDNHGLRVRCLENSGGCRCARKGWSSTSGLRARWRAGLSALPQAGLHYSFLPPICFLTGLEFSRYEQYFAKYLCT